jgi:tetratricopeptide (TPR) repeat protein
MKKQSIACFILGVLILGSSLLVSGCADPHQKAKDLLAEAQQLRDDEIADGPEAKKARLDEMLKLLEQAVRLDPEFLEPRIAIALTRWEKGDQIEAVRMSEDLCERFPDRHKVWDLAGGFLTQIQKGQDAIDAYKKAIELGGDKKELLLKLGATAGKHGQFEEAFEAFEEALEHGASPFVVEFNFGLCYEGTKQYELALESYLKSLEENPSYVPALLKLTEFYLDFNVPGAPDLDIAEKYAKKAYESSPSDIKVLSNLVDIYINRKDFASAIRLVEETLKLHPDDPQLLKYKSGLEKVMEAEAAKEAKEKNQDQE